MYFYQPEQLFEFLENRLDRKTFFNKSLVKFSQICYFQSAEKINYQVEVGKTFYFCSDHSLPSRSLNWQKSLEKQANKFSGNNKDWNWPPPGWQKLFLFGHKRRGLRWAGVSWVAEICSSFKEKSVLSPPSLSPVRWTINNIKYLFVFIILERFFSDGK